MANVLDESFIIGEGEPVVGDVLGGVSDGMLTEVGDDCGCPSDGDDGADVTGGKFRRGVMPVRRGGVEPGVNRREGGGLGHVTSALAFPVVSV